MTTAHTHLQRFQKETWSMLVTAEIAGLDRILKGRIVSFKMAM
jgi:hypothetical protein